MSQFKVGDLVRFRIPADFWDEALYGEEEHYGIGLVVERGPEQTLLPEHLVLWAKIGQTTWEWEEFLEKIVENEDR